MDEAQGEITSALKRRLGEVNKTVNDAKESLEFTHGEHADDLAERVTNCENEQSTHWDELTHIQIYSRRWNLIFYRVNESRDEDCFALARNVLSQNLNLPMEVSKMKLCGTHRLGKLNRSKSRPLIVRFTCRADRDRVWNARYKLKNSSISVGEYLPRHIQEIRKSTLIPVMKRIKSETPEVKASVVGDKLIVNGKICFHYNIPKEWLPSRSCSIAHEKSAPAADSHQEPLSNQDE